MRNLLNNEIFSQRNSPCKYKPLQKIVNDCLPIITTLKEKLCYPNATITTTITTQRNYQNLWFIVIFLFFICINHYEMLSETCEMITDDWVIISVKN